MRKRRCILWIVCLTALIVAVLACVTRPSSPSGCYVADNTIGQAGDLYWEFSKGKAALVSEDDKEMCGTYSRTPEGWLWQDDHGKGRPDVCMIRCSWWRLRLYNQSGEQVGSMRRRVIPVLRPHWFQRWIPDWVQ